MSALGDDLRLARERAGISLHGLSERTKIREGLLDAIEHDDFARLPAGLLTRGFLRAYTREVGLEPESIVKRYKTEFKAPTPPHAGPQPRTDLDIHILARRIQIGLVAIVAVGIIAVLIYATRDGNLNPSLANVASTGDNSNGSGVTTSGEPVRRAVDAPASGPLTMTINPTRVVWVQAAADGRRVLYSLIHPNQPYVIEAAEQIELRVGDAGAFQFTIDGVRGRPLGVPGEVRVVRITRDNRLDFRAP